MHYGHSQFIILNLFTSDRVYLSGCLAAFNFEELNDVFLLTTRSYIYIIYKIVYILVYRSLLGYFLE